MPLQFRWDIDGDGTFAENVTGATPSLSATDLQTLGLADGPFEGTITVEVSDGSNVATAVAALTITNEDPEIVELTNSTSFEQKGLLDGDLVVTNRGQATAEYRNSYGYYVKALDGSPLSGQIIWADTKGNIGQGVVLHGLDPESVGFFLIPNGQVLNPTLTNETDVVFQQDEHDQWYAATLDGLLLIGQDANAFFTDKSLNPDNKKHAKDAQAVGNQNWEDLWGNGDRDFDDVNVDVTQAAHVVVTGSFADRGAPDTHTVTIRWGDGTQTTLDESDPRVDQVNDSFTVEHKYVTGGIFNVKATVSDDDGGTATKRTKVVVSGVRLSANGELQIVGTPLQDDVRVKYESTADGQSWIRVIAKLGSEQPGDWRRYNERFDAQQVDRIRIELCDGDDHATVGTSGGNDAGEQAPIIPAIIKGGNGSDVLDGGDGPDQILGGNGDDRISGRNGDDLLQGGRGLDHIEGGAGNDILQGGNHDDQLIGGRDNDLLVGGRGEDHLKGNGGDDILIGARFALNQASLIEALETWNSDSTYEDRVLALTQPGGLLEPDVNAVTEDTTDQLKGAGGIDLFFAQLGGAAPDSTDAKPDEQLLELTL